MTEATAAVVTTATGEELLQLSEEHPAVAATPCLEWSDAQNSSVTLPIHRARKYFLSGLGMDTHAVTTNVLDLRLTPERWSSVLENLTQQGVFDTIFTQGYDLQEAICDAQSRLPDQDRTLTADDIRAPATTAAPRGSRRQSTEPTEGDEDDPSIRFLAKTQVAALVGEGDRPMRHLCYLWGMLGPTSAAKRTQAGSSLRVVASLLRHYIATFMKQPKDACDDVLAASLRPFLAATELDEVMQSGRTDDVTLRNEGMDGIR